MQEYYRDFHSKYPTLNHKERGYAEAGIEWLIRNGAEPLTKKKMKRGIKQAVKRKYGLDPITMFFLTFILSKIASWVIEWFTNRFN